MLITDVYNVVVLFWDLTETWVAKRLLRRFDRPRVRTPARSTPCLACGFLLNGLPSASLPQTLNPLHEKYVHSSVNPAHIDGLSLYCNLGSRSCARDCVKMFLVSRVQIAQFGGIAAMC